MKIEIKITYKGEVYQTKKIMDGINLLSPAIARLYCKDLLGIMTKEFDKIIFGRKDEKIN
jgi:hypothetical protein